MATTPKRNCKTCGAEFDASPADFTVNCPAHRGRTTAASRQTRSKTQTCACGKTVTVDGFGHATGQTCPRECE